MEELTWIWRTRYLKHITSAYRRVLEVPNSIHDGVLDSFILFHRNFYGEDVVGIVGAQQQGTRCSITALLEKSFVSQYMAFMSGNILLTAHRREIGGWVLRSERSRFLGRLADL